MTTDVERLVRRLRQHALPDPHDGRSVMHADLFTDAADQLENLKALLDLALAGLESTPHSWGFDITHVEPIKRKLNRA